MPAYSSKSRVVFGVLALAVLSAAIGARARAPRAQNSTPGVERTSALTPSPSSVPAVAAPSRAPDLEESIMQRLHALGETSPEATLGLALEGNTRFPGSADAPERGWIICRSLVNLGRFREAVAEARVVVEQYPSTPWASDVERHLLVNPMSDPSERGYGHGSELE